MRRTSIGALIVLACLAVGGCGGGSTPSEDPPPSEASEVDSTTTDDGSGGDDGDGSGDGGETDLPGVPGSPITYDHTVLLAGPVGAKADVERRIRDHCGADLCGVQVVYAGEGPCVLSITPPPVEPGGTVTLELGECEFPPEPEPEPDTGETTTEAG